MMQIVDKMLRTWENKYARARIISKYVTRTMYACAFIMVANKHIQLDSYFPYWDVVMRFNTFLLLLVNLGLLYVGYLNFKARSNKIEWAIDDAYGTRLSFPPCSPGYYDNQEVQEGDLRYVLNVYESCFFSESILSRMMLRILITNGILFALVLIAFTLDKNGWVVTILQTFLAAYVFKKMLMFCVVKSELSRLGSKFRDILSQYKKAKHNGIDKPSAILTVIEYETTMVWLNTVLSDEVYKDINKELTEKWKDHLKQYIDIKNN